MSEASQIPNAVVRATLEPAKTSVFDWGVGTILDARAEMLADAETMMTAWLRRRREAVLDTKQLLAQSQISADPAGAFTAQRQWVSRSLQRLTADADAAARWMMTRAPGWVPQGGWNWLSQIAEGSHAD
jgi:hypothetical protein